MDIGWFDATAVRLHRQGLVAGASSIEAAVTGMVGAHAQVMSAAELSIAARTRDTTAADVRDRLLPGGSLVKTYGPRGTIHLLPRADLPRWCAALGALPSSTTLPEPARLSPKQSAQVVEAISVVLAGADQPPDGEQLDALVVAATGPWASDPVTPAFGGQWPRWRQAIGAAARAGVLAFGENRGTKVTYLNPGVVVDPDTEGSARWLARQFLRSYGPATSKQFARWLGARPALTAALFERMSAELVTVRFEGEDAAMQAGDPEEPLSGGDPAPARLLPHFDPYVIGNTPRERVYPGDALTRAQAGGQAGTRPVLLVGGEVAGIWSAKRTTKRYDVTVQAFGRLSRQVRDDLRRDAEGFARFLGLHGTFAEGSVTAGAHR